MTKANGSDPPSQTRRKPVGEYVWEGGTWRDAQRRNAFGEHPYAALGFSLGVALEEAAEKDADFHQAQPKGPAGPRYQVERDRRDGRSIYRAFLAVEATTGRHRSNGEGREADAEPEPEPEEPEPDGERAAEPEPGDDAPAPEDLPSEEESGRSTQVTILQQHAVARRDDLSGSEKLLLQNIGLSQPGNGELTPRRLSTLARETGFSREGVRRIGRRLFDHSLLDRGPSHNPARRCPSWGIAVEPSDALKRQVVKMWQAGTLKYPPPVYHKHQERLDYGYQWKRIGWIWIRAVRASDLPSSARGLCHAIKLLTNKAGRLFRPTTKRELSDWSGYAPNTVREQLRSLEDDGWLWVERAGGHPDQGAGLSPWPVLPKNVQQLVSEGIWTGRPDWV